MNGFYLVTMMTIGFSQLSYGAHPAVVSREVLTNNSSLLYNLYKSGNPKGGCQPYRDVFKKLTIMRTIFVGDKENAWTYRVPIAQVDYGVCETFPGTSRTKGKESRFRYAYVDAKKQLTDFGVRGYLEVSANRESTKNLVFQRNPERETGFLMNDDCCKSVMLGERIDLDSAEECPEQAFIESAFNVDQAKVKAWESGVPVEHPLPRKKREQ